MADPQPPIASNARWLGWLVPAAGGFLGAALAAFIAQPAPEAWCTFTEFGYLSRIGPALVMLVLIGLAAVLGLIGLLVAIARRRASRWFAVGGGVLLGALIVPRLLEPDCASVLGLG